MHPLALERPKALFDVHGEPFAFHQLRCMQAGGVTDVVYCIGHLGEQIRSAVGNHSCSTRDSG